MIKDLSLSLKALLKGEATPSSALAAATISLGAPDADWRGAASGLVLDVYLYQVMENRELRTNERHLRHNQDGTTTAELAPARVDCAYVISAWNFATATGGTAEPEEQEQRLLSQALAVLLRNPTVPHRYLVGLANQTVDLPMMAAEPGTGIGTSGEYWGSFDTYLRPTIDCRVTMALDLLRDVTGPTVTTVQVQHAPDEALFLIGGVVRAATSAAAPVPAAWVRVVETGQTVVTDESGRFVLAHLPGGMVTLVARAVGYQEGTPTQVQLPQPDGVYDLTLTPL
jgi:hypothetical protein